MGIPQGSEALTLPEALIHPSDHRLEPMSEREPAGPASFLENKDDMNRFICQSGFFQHFISPKSEE
jgi:hypothetical protein